MEVIKNFMAEYSSMIIYTTLTGIISYLGYRIQLIYENYIKEKIKKEQAKIVCEAINQLYKELSNEEKLNKAIENLKIILSEKSISSSDLEIRLLIESSIHKLKKT